MQMSFNFIKIITGDFMKNLTVFKTYIIIVLVTAASFNYAQDSSKIIILSKDVGLVVDSEERKEFEILPRFDDDAGLERLFSAHPRLAERLYKANNAPDLYLQASGSSDWLKPA